MSTTISGYAQPLRDSTTVSEVVRSHRATPAINTGYQYLCVVSKQTLAATYHMEVAGRVYLCFVSK
jgi:hypothetical protein